MQGAVDGFEEGRGSELGNARCLERFREAKNGSEAPAPCWPRA